MMIATRKMRGVKNPGWMECRLCGGKVGFAGNSLEETIASSIRHIIEVHKFYKFEVDPITGIVKTGG